jgi:hypothetical protein
MGGRQSHPVRYAMPVVFPWPTPDPGDLRDPGGWSNAGTARDIVLWFMRTWAPGYELPPTSPMGTILEAVARHGRREATAPLESNVETAAWEHRFLVLRLLARRISALHGRAGVLRDVHESFITQELSGIDNQTAMWGMPRGVGTVCLAGRLLQASGGDLVILGHGKAGAGHDIRWSPATGGEALIERKDRAYAQGADESVGRRIRYVIGQVREAGPKLPHREGAARVLAVGFPGFISANKAARVRSRIVERLSEAVGPSPSPERNPDYLIIEFLGAQHTLTGGYNLGTFSHAVDFGFDRPEWLAVRRGFSRAFTVAGAFEPGPWPIQADYVPRSGPANQATSVEPRRRHRNGRRRRT